MSNSISYTLVNQAFKIRLYPTIEQKSFLDKTFGCSRFVYNSYLAEKNKFFEEHVKPIREEFDYYNLLEKFNKLQKNKSKTKEQKKEQKELKVLLDKIKNISNQEWKKYKKTTPADLKKKYTWLKESNSQALCAAQMNVDSAFKNFYEGRTEFPKFHSKKNKQSFKDCMMKQNFFDWNSKTVDLPKVGKIKFKNRSLPKWYKKHTKVCSYTCSKTPNGNYYISILFETKLNFAEKSKSTEIDENQIIGLDFDCGDMYIDSNGKSALKDFGFKKQKQSNLKKLSHLQRKMLRKHKSSKNREKARIKLASFEEHIANARLDWIEKESLRLTKSYKLIGLENLNISAMQKGSKNAKNYQDIAWSTFVSKLQWKSEKNGCHVVKIDKWFPSSQTCSCCGYKNKEVQIKHLEKWICPDCGKEHQRDKNAAKNIAAESYKVLREAEENLERSSEMNLSKDTSSLLSNNLLANLVLDI